MVTGETCPILQGGGFSAHVDAFAWEPDPDPGACRMRLWLLSLLGPQQSVKALWAGLIKGGVASMRLEDGGAMRFCALASHGPRAWRFFTASLPAAAGYQGMLVPEAAFYTTDRPDFLLVSRPHDEAAALHYRFLTRRVDLPLHRAWATWLWDRGLRAGEIVPLEAQGVAAYRCLPDPTALARDLTVAVQRGLLPLSDADPVLGSSASEDGT